MLIRISECESFVCGNPEAETVNGDGDGVPDYCLNGLFFSVIKPD